MRKIHWLWTIAIVVTIVSAIYQRMTGPTYPVRGHVVLGGEEIYYRLERAQDTSADQIVQIRVPDTAVTGEMKWRRVPSSEPYQTVLLVRRGDILEGALPRQPVAGKLEYQIRLVRPPEVVVVPPKPAITRFKNPVPLHVLIPHVLAMFLGMLWSTRAGLSAVTGGNTRVLTWMALSFLAVGGFVLGPWMQHHVFGAWWTGVPFGFDLTDNKTLIAIAVWAFTAWRLKGGRQARLAVAVAALVKLAVFAIPHSAWGSQIEWDALPKV